MGQLGELLALMHGANGSFTSLSAVMREWTDVPVHEALLRTGAVRAVAELPEQPLGEEIEERTRLWVEKPDRMREERVSGPFSPYVRVHDGPRWSEWDPQGGFDTNAGDEAVGDALQVRHREMLDPAPVIPLLDFGDVAAAEVGGRAALRVHARPRLGQASRLEWLSWLGDTHELLVDRERGIILRMESSVHGKPFTVVELLDLAFDIPIPEATWTSVVPPTTD